MHNPSTIESSRPHPVLRDGAGHPARMGEAPDGVTPVESPATEHYGPRSRTNTPQVPFVSPGTRRSALLSNATCRRSAESEGYALPPWTRNARGDQFYFSPRLWDAPAARPTKPLLGAGTLHWP